MKIIDLLNKIANGEIPKTIILDHHKYQYSELEKDYYEGMGYDYEFFFKNSDLSCLNDEVEIVEEENKITRKLNTLNTLNANDYTRECYYENYSKEEIALDIETLQNWVNEIIDYLNSKGDE